MGSHIREMSNLGRAVVRFPNLCLDRREELATRARRRREANAERKRRLERRRLKEAEAMRIKHEGASKAELVSKRTVPKAVECYDSCRRTTVVNVHPVSVPYTIFWESISSR